MTEKTKKQRVSLWLSKSKKGQDYLSGFDKASNMRYVVFKDDEDATVRKVFTKDGSSKEGKLEAIAILKQKTKDTGEIVFSDGSYYLCANSYYYSDDEDAAAGGVRYLTRRDGSQVLNREGKPVEKNSHVLLLPNV